MPTHFSPDTMKFLRGLKRNNDREWFEARRDVYESALRAPMLALVEEINAAMDGKAASGFAPQHVRSPQKIVMRIYRDIRFSKNKIPYKTHMSAWWSRRGMEKTSGGGYYLQVGPNEVMVAAGVYMPERDQLLRIRTWMAENHVAYRKLLKTAIGKRVGFGEIDSHALTRMPKGFAADHPADELLRAKDWGVSASLPAELMFEPALANEIVKRFKIAAPLVNALNGAILGGDEGPSRVLRKPMF